MELVARKDGYTKVLHDASIITFGVSENIEIVDYKARGRVGDHELMQIVGHFYETVCLNRASGERAA
jgi:hypothetical protein